MLLVACLFIPASNFTTLGQDYGTCINNHRPLVCKSNKSFVYGHYSPLDPVHKPEDLVTTPCSHCFQRHCRVSQWRESCMLFCCLVQAGRHTQFGKSKGKSALYSN